MIEKYLEIEALSVVFIGDFNPVIFQPFWMLSKGLIREEEAESAKIEVIHNEVVRYKLGGWLNVDITRNRCEFKTSKKPYFYPFKDLIVDIFSILKETPIKSFGVNNVYDLSLKTQENYYSFGNKLTPLNYWNDDLNDPRLLQLEIYEEKRKENPNNSRRIRITPSDQKISFGVSVDINNHYQLKENSNGLHAITELEEIWEKSFLQSEALVNVLLNKVFQNDAN